MRTRGRCAPLLIRLLVCAASVRVGSAARPYTVDDSIEIASFVNYGMSEETLAPGVPIDSPDAKRFLLITERGIAASNRTESTIWLLDRRGVEDFVLGKSAHRPFPRALVTMSATTNLPVISGVRWLDDRTVAFLGKNGRPLQQLFTVNVDSGQLTARTPEDRYASSYDIRGDTVAYTAVIEPPPADTTEALVSARDTTFSRLLYPNLPPVAVATIGEITQYPLALRVVRGGTERTISTPRLFAPAWSMSPPLSISPDGNTVITLAPVPRIPPAWAAYEPWEHPEQLRLRPGDAQQTDEANDLKPLQFVAIDLRDGEVKPLIDAPSGRSLEYLAPIDVFWLSPRRVIVSNTFLAGRPESPYVAVVDLDTHSVEPIAALRTPARKAGDYREIENIAWSAATNELTVSYSVRNGEPPPPPDVFALRSGKWLKQPQSRAPKRQRVELSVDEAFDRPPRFVGRAGSAPALTIFDPNPQLASIALGRVTLEQWSGTDGRTWKALLAVPPDLDPKRRYPMVIQTHGYRVDKFFKDGIFTTGMPGRALVARGFVVLQMPNLPAKFLTPEDGPNNLAAFESAVDHFERIGLIDRNRVGIIGFSFTCWHTMYALANHPSLFAAAAITDGNQMSYSQYIFDDPNGFNQKYSDATIGGPPWGNLTLWMERSPDFNLQKVRTPLLISALERGALIRHWEPFAGLQRLSKPVDLLWLRGEQAPHVLVQPRHVRLSQQTAVDWFDFWLNDREDPDPDKRAQYERWRELRKR